MNIPEIPTNGFQIYWDSNLRISNPHEENCLCVRGFFLLYRQAIALVLTDDYTSSDTENYIYRCLSRNLSVMGCPEYVVHSPIAFRKYSVLEMECYFGYLPCCPQYPPGKTLFCGFLFWPGLRNRCVPLASMSGILQATIGGLT